MHISRFLTHFYILTQFHIEQSLTSFNFLLCIHRQEACLLLTYHQYLFNLKVLTLYYNTHITILLLLETCIHKNKKKTPFRMKLTLTLPLEAHHFVTTNFPFSIYRHICYYNSNIALSVFSFFFKQTINSYQNLHSF